jgi:DNA polymerase elongation subunit (family B)
VTQVFDVECYPNFFLVLFKDVETGKVTRFQASPNVQLDVVGLRRMLTINRIVGFNSRNYDIPMCMLALKTPIPYELYLASCKIISEGMWIKEFMELYGLERHNFDSIDLIEVAPLKGSLKIYAGRLHCTKMQDLPFDPHAEVTAEQAKLLYTYCCNDLENTILLWNELAGQINLRGELSNQYGQDLRSKSDAQIAEAVIGSEVAKIIGYYPRRSEGIKKKVNYDVPNNVSYSSPRLQLLLEEIRGAKFSVNVNGGAEMPDCLNTTIRIGHGSYRMGIGGLHSSEKSVFHVADESTFLIDRDVASYYPSIILNQRLYPSHLGPAFLEVYETIVARRLAAKAAGNKLVAESLKITINGGFGKFGSKWSILYSPQLLIQVTISGQLYLLMLIEMIEASGIEVISANTDGVTIKCPKSRYNDLQATIKHWETVTGFATEEGRYKSVYMRDVNNYIALKEKGGYKLKGAYAI